MKKKYSVEIPSMSKIESERKRIRRGKYYKRAFVGTVSVLVVVAAIAVLITTLFMPILQISGDSMSPTLKNNEIIVMLKNDSFRRGDLIGFYYQGKILIKRVIALPEEEVVIDAEGSVYINGELLDEPYIVDKSIGDCDIEFPYTVPVGCCFVLGDRRSNSVDSRNSAIGAVSNEDVIGKAILRVWPFSRIGIVR